MRVIVVCDASFSADEGVGAYAYFINSKRKKGGGHHPFKQHPRTSVEAEMMAIANSVLHGLQRRMIKKHDKVVIRSDNREAYRHLTTGKTYISRKFMSLVEGCYLNVRFLWIKGHSDKEDPHSLCHAECDRLARKDMRKEVLMQALSGKRSVYEEPCNVPN